MILIWEWTISKYYERYKRESTKKIDSNYQRIVGGYSPKERPWMALIEMQQMHENKLKGHAQCGGAIINKVNFLHLSFYKGKSHLNLLHCWLEHVWNSEKILAQAKHIFDTFEYFWVDHKSKFFCNYLVTRWHHHHFCWKLEFWINLLSKIGSKMPKIKLNCFTVQCF